MDHGEPIHIPFSSLRLSADERRWLMAQVALTSHERRVITVKRARTIRVEFEQLKPSPKRGSK